MFWFLLMDDPTASARRPEPSEAAVAAIVRDILAGNRDAFEEIVFLYRDQVHATAWQITHDAEDAMDVAQEVFVRVYRALGSFKGNSRFSTWLHRIILNTCMDHVRREKRHRQGKVELDAEEDGEDRPKHREPSVPHTQRETVYAHELQVQVLEALKLISARQRQVFLLRYYQELSLEEIGEVLRCSPGTIKRHLYRAQMRLKELLKDITVR
jgi:RNA polymerase sigma-70 factor (ECF subfamily)